MYCYLQHSGVESESVTAREQEPCPPLHVRRCWLHDYVTWHKANRGKPGAKVRRASMF